MGELRICLVSPAYVPSLGGLERLVFEHARAMRAVGNDVTVLTQCRDDDSRRAPSHEVQSDGTSIRRFWVPIGRKQYGVSPALLKYLRKHQSDFDLVHTWNYHSPLPLAVSYGVQLPIVITPVLHGTGHSTLAKIIHIGYRRAAHRIFETAATIVCGSASEAKLLSSMYPQASAKIEVLAPGLTRSSASDVEPFAELAPVILSVSRLESYKQVDNLLMAMEAVDRDAILVIVGDGPERANLELLQTMATRPNSIRILGRVDDDELARWQRTAHVVVSLSLHESFGLSLAEGIAAGASIVASAIPAHLDLQAFSPVPFFLVDAEAGVREIGEALNAALAQPKSSDTSSRLPTWEEVAKRFEVLYTNAIESFGNN